MANENQGPMKLKKPEEQKQKPKGKEPVVIEVTDEHMKKLDELVASGKYDMSEASLHDDFAVVCAEVGLQDLVFLGIGGALLTSSKAPHLLRPMGGAMIGGVVTGRLADVFTDDPATLAKASGWGGAIGGGAAFILTTEKGNKVLKIFREVPERYKGVKEVFMAQDKGLAKIYAETYNKYSMEIRELFAEQITREMSGTVRGASEAFMGKFGGLASPNAKYELAKGLVDDMAEQFMKKGLLSPEDASRLFDAVVDAQARGGRTETITLVNAILDIAEGEATEAAKVNDISTAIMKAMPKEVPAKFLTEGEAEKAITSILGKKGDPAEKLVAWAKERKIIDESLTREQAMKQLGGRSAEKLAKGIEGAGDSPFMTKVRTAWKRVGKKTKALLFVLGLVAVGVGSTMHTGGSEHGYVGAPQETRRTKADKAYKGLVEARAELINTVNTKTNVSNNEHYAIVGTDGTGGVLGEYLDEKIVNYTKISSAEGDKKLRSSYEKKIDKLREALEEAYGDEELVEEMRGINPEFPRVAATHYALAKLFMDEDTRDMAKQGFGQDIAGLEMFAQQLPGYAQIQDVMNGIISSGDVPSNLEKAVESKAGKTMAFKFLSSFGYFGMKAEDLGSAIEARKEYTPKLDKLLGAIPEQARGQAEEYLADAQNIVFAEDIGLAGAAKSTPQAYANASTLSETISKEIELKGTTVIAIPGITVNREGGALQGTGYMFLAFPHAGGMGAVGVNDKSLNGTIRMHSTGDDTIITFRDVDDPRGYNSLSSIVAPGEPFTLLIKFDQTNRRMEYSAVVGEEFKPLYSVGYDQLTTRYGASCAPYAKEGKTYVKMGFGGTWRGGAGNSATTTVQY